jgi:hypothetical protein
MDAVLGGIDVGTQFNVVPDVILQGLRVHHIPRLHIFIGHKGDLVAVLLTVPLMFFRGAAAAGLSLDMPDMSPWANDAMLAITESARARTNSFFMSISFKSENMCRSTRVPLSLRRGEPNGFTQIAATVMELLRLVAAPVPNSFLMFPLRYLVSTD